MFAGGSITMFRVAGVPVRAHWSLLLVIPYLVLMFALRFSAVARLSGVDPSTVTLPPLLWGLFIAIGLFASVALHELMHAVVALWRGGRVHAITLMMLGGVSEIDRVPGRPTNEALVAAAGPAVSLALGAVLLLLLGLPLGPDLRFGFFYLGQLNIVLGVFNLLPAFPMDGGRVLRSLLTLRTGPLKATRIAARVGRAVAVGLGLLGLWSGNFLLVLIAVFVFAGAGAERRMEEARALLKNLRVGDVMTWPATTLSADDTTADALERMRSAGRLELVVVEPAGGQLGLVRADDLRADDDRRLRELAAVWERGLAVAVDTPLDQALERAARQRRPYLFVVDDGTLVGIVSSREVENAVKLQTIRARRMRPVEPRPV